MHFINSREAHISDKEKFNIIYKMYYRYVYKIAISILKSDKYIDDVVQETFMKIWKSIGSIDIEDSEGCKAFICVVSKNTAINKYNVDKKSSSKIFEIDNDVLFATTGDDSSDPADIIASDENVNYIYSVIDELGDRYNQVMMLKYKQDHTPEETSALTGLNIKTVYTKLSRGRDLLKAKLMKERRNMQ